MDEKKPTQKSESQKKAEATIAARTLLEQAVITLANQTAAEVKVWEVSLEDLKRIREIVKDNTERHFALLGEPEKEYSGFRAGEGRYFKLPGKGVRRRYICTLPHPSLG